MKTKIKVHGELISLPGNLHHHLELVLDSFPMSASMKRIAINFCDTSYFHRREGLHPVEMHCERDESNANLWHLIFITSLSYPNEYQSTVTPELYFNFKRGCFYQPDLNSCSLAIPQVMDLFRSWGNAFCWQLRMNRFDDIYINEVKS